MTTLEKIRSEIQKVLDAEGDSESAKAQALALLWVLELFDKYAEQEPCEDAISRKVVIQTLNKMDRYTATELTLCDTDKKFPANEVFIVDDVYEQIAEQLPSVTPKPIECDVVSRQAVLDEFHDLTNLYERIKQLPSVQPKAKQGRWITGINWKCNNCGFVDSGAHGFNFCPNCGAKMVVKQESEEEYADSHRSR